VAGNDQEFIARIKQTMASPQLHRSLRVACRAAASRKSWETVLDELNVAYQACQWQPSKQPRRAALPQTV